MIGYGIICKKEYMDTELEKIIIQSLASNGYNDVEFVKEDDSKVFENDNFRLSFKSNVIMLMISMSILSNSDLYYELMDNLYLKLKEAESLQTHLTMFNLESDHVKFDDVFASLKIDKDEVSGQVESIIIKKKLEDNIEVSYEVKNDRKTILITCENENTDLHPGDLIIVLLKIILGSK